MVLAVDLFKCLADNTRLNSLVLLFECGELCVCELTEALTESQPKVSRHLAVLRACGLILKRRQGPWMHYRLNPDLPHWVHSVIHLTARNQRSALGAARPRVKHKSDRARSAHREALC